MIADSNVQDKMPDNENKKIWMLPELEVLDGRKTYGGGDPESCEHFDCINNDDPFGVVS